MSWYGLVTFSVAYVLAVATPGLFAAALGLSALAHTAHAAFLAVKYAGAVYLLYLAYELWTAPVQPLTVNADESARQKPAKLFFGSLALTLGNPKPMIFWPLPSRLPRGRTCFPF